MAVETEAKAKKLATEPVVKSATTAEAKTKTKKGVEEKGQQASAAKSKAAEPATRTAAATLAADDLTEIKGIGPVFAERLRQAGITTFADVAQASADQLYIGDKPFKGKVVGSGKQLWVSLPELVQAADLVLSEFNGNWVLHQKGEPASLPLFTRGAVTFVATASGANVLANLSSVGVRVTFQNTLTAGRTAAYASLIHPDDLPAGNRREAVYEIGSSVRMSPGT